MRDIIRGWSNLFLHYSLLKSQKIVGFKEKDYICRKIVMEKKVITIDIDVYKVLENHRLSFNESHNEILRRLLKIENKKGVDIVKFDTSNKADHNNLIWKGIELKDGLLLRKYLKGTLHSARVVNAKIVYNGEDFSSPSAAGMAAAGNNVNGWVFWEYYNEEFKNWELLDNLRKGKTINISSPKTIYNMSVNLEIIKEALILLGKEAEASEIKDKVTELLGGIPNHYKNKRSFRETIQNFIERYCPESDNFNGTRVFSRIEYGRYRLII